MDDLVFDTSEAQQEQIGTIVLDGQPYVLHAPKQAAMLRLAATDGQQVADQAQASLDFLWGCLDKDGRAIMQARLADPDDQLDTDFLLIQVVPAIMEKVTGRPTGSSSASTRRRRPTKKASTAPSRSRESTQAG